MNIPTNQQQVEAWHREWLGCNGPHWGDRVDWKTADEIARRLDVARAVQPESCDVPPEGWYCTRPKGHDGPCAAHLHPQ